MPLGEISAECCELHTRNGAHTFQKLLLITRNPAMLTRSEPVAVEILRRKREASRQNMFGLKTGRDAHQVPKALGHQTGTDQEDQGDCDLSHDQSTPQMRSNGDTTAAFFQRFISAHLLRWKPLNESERQSGSH